MAEQPNGDPVKGKESMLAIMKMGSIVCQAMLHTQHGKDTQRTLDGYREAVASTKPWLDRIAQYLEGNEVLLDHLHADAKLDNPGLRKAMRTLTSVLPHKGKQHGAGSSWKLRLSKQLHKNIYREVREMEKEIQRLERLLEGKHRRRRRHRRSKKDEESEGDGESGGESDGPSDSGEAPGNQSSRPGSTIGRPSGSMTGHAGSTPTSGNNGQASPQPPCPREGFPGPELVPPSSGDYTAPVHGYSGAGSAGGNNGQGRPGGPYHQAGPAGGFNRQGMPGAPYSQAAPSGGINGQGLPGFPYPHGSANSGINGQAMPGTAHLPGDPHESAQTAGRPQSHASGIPSHYTGGSSISGSTGQASSRTAGATTQGPNDQSVAGGQETHVRFPSPVPSMVNVRNVTSPGPHVPQPSVVQGQHVPPSALHNGPTHAEGQAPQSGEYFPQQGFTTQGSQAPPQGSHHDPAQSGLMPGAGDDGESDGESHHSRQTRAPTIDSSDVASSSTDRSETESQASTAKPPAHSRTQDRDRSSKASSKQSDTGGRHDGHRAQRQESAPGCHHGNSRASTHDSETSSKGCSTRSSRRQKTHLGPVSEEGDAESAGSEVRSSTSNATSSRPSTVQTAFRDPSVRNIPHAMPQQYAAPGSRHSHKGSVHSSRSSPTARQGRGPESRTGASSSTKSSRESDVASSCSSTLAHTSSTKKSASSPNEEVPDEEVPEDSSGWSFMTPKASSRGSSRKERKASTTRPTPEHQPKTMSPEAASTAKGSHLSTTAEEDEVSEVDLFGHKKEERRKKCHHADDDSRKPSECDSEESTQVGEES